MIGLRLTVGQVILLDLTVLAVEPVEDDGWTPPPPTLGFR